MQNITPKHIILAALIGVMLFGGGILLLRERGDMKDAAPNPPRAGVSDQVPSSRHLNDAVSGKSATSPLVNAAPSKPGPFVLDLKSAQKLEKLEFIKEATGAGIDADFAALFKLTPEQLSKAEMAMRTARQKLNETEIAKITNLQKSGERVTFEIPFFMQEGVAIRQELFDGLKAALPPEVFEYIQQNEERFFQYQWADFGKLARKFEISPQTKHPDGRETEKWLMVENVFMRAADWAIKEGRPAELEAGSKFHRFDTIPERFEHLLSLP